MQKTSIVWPKCWLERFPITAAGCFALMLLLFCSSLSADAVAAPDPAMKRYVAKYHGLAEKKSAKYSIPADIILAVAIVESGSGKTRIARDFHNHFGLVGKNHLKRKTRYKSYPTVESSYDHFCRYLAKQRFYRKLSKGADKRAWVKAISRIGYSERPKIWEKRVLLILKEIRGL